MKYTKYQYKKKKNGIKLLTSLVMTTLSAISIGLLAAWLLLKVIPNINELEVNNKPQVEEANSNGDAAQVEEVETFTVIQGGYFSKEENANQALSKIGKEFNSFIVKDAEGKYKVIAAVTKEEKSSEIMQKLNDNGIENIKVNLSLNKGDNVENQISAITIGLLDILDTVGKEEVKEVNTNDFKIWTNELEEITEGNGIDVLKEYKEHIKALPESINKTNIISELEYIYSVLNGI